MLESMTPVLELDTFVDWFNVLKQLDIDRHEISRETRVARAAIKALLHESLQKLNEARKRRHEAKEPMQVAAKDYETFLNVWLEGYDLPKISMRTRTED